MFCKKYICAAILACCACNCYPQNRNSIWCFGDSAGIDFNDVSNPIQIHSVVNSRGSCASIADSIGHLIFYSGYDTDWLSGGSVDYNGEVYNNTHHLMQNGDLIITAAWYNEQVILPMPNSADKYYLFSINVIGGLGLYYSIIDMTLDSGRGAVTQKNIQLLSMQTNDGIAAIKHGNGRDWWVVSRRWDSVNDEFYKFLISPTGITGPNISHAGTATNDGFYWMSFSTSGDKFVGFDPAGLIELFDFDRCSGNISFNTAISSEATAAPYPYYWGAAFSPNEELLYISKYTDSVPDYPTFLIQFDLNAPNIFASADTIWSYFSSPIAGGQMKMAPDGKIYLACVWSDGVNFNYPYPDSAFYNVNNNLSVINYPDSPGVACGFVPFSFNLGAGRCYWGLPNNPDYELGPDTNSMCDTVTAVAAVGSGSRQEKLHVFYHSGWQIAFINAENLAGKKYDLQVYDLFGREVYREEGRLNSAYLTKDLNCEGFANGMYIVTLQTGPDGSGEKLVKRFIKQ